MDQGPLSIGIQQNQANMAHTTTHPFCNNRGGTLVRSLRFCAMLLILVATAAAPLTALGQMERVYLRHSQSNPGTGGIVRDLLPTQGANGTVTTSNTSSSSFSERLAFTIDHADLPNAVGGTSFDVSVNVSDRSSSFLRARFRLQRTSGSGVVQSSSAYSSEFNSTGIKTATFTLPQDWAPGDRLRLSMEVRATIGNNRNITVRTGNANSWVDYVPYNPCTGTPSPGNTLASVSITCADVPFNLSLQNAIPGDGVTYQWQSSTNGSTWANVAGAQSTTLGTNQVAATWYRCAVTCDGNTGHSNPVQVNMDAVANCYCNAQALSTSYERITLVQVADIDHASTANVGYEDLTTVVGHMMAGSTYPLTVQYGWAEAPNGYTPDQVLIWIDLDNNGNFDGPGELVYSSATGLSPRTGSITIPANTQPVTTRMRVRLHDTYTGSQYSNTPNATPCGNSTYGQVEDYTVTILPSVLYSTGNGSMGDAIWAYTPGGPANGASTTGQVKVVIQSGHSIVLDNNASVGDLVLESGATLEIPEERMLTVYGDDVQLHGSVTGLGGIHLAGAAHTTLRTNSTVDLQELVVEVPDGVTAEGTFRINGTLHLAVGTFDATDAQIVLRSTSTGTGRLGPVGSSADYLGEMTVERRIPGGVTNWRLLGSAVEGRTVADWNDDFFTAGFPGSNYPNFYSGGVLWPSIRWYDETVASADQFDGLVGVSSTAQALEVGRGYAVWSGDAAGGTSSFKVDVTGAPTIAHTPVALPVTWTNTGNSEVDGWNLVSNPLPSPVSFAQIARGADVENAYWIYNPTNGNNASWNGTVGTNGANGIIQSSQGFWLKANGPAVTTTVGEGAKVSGNAGGLFGGPVQQGGELPLLRLKVSSGMNNFSDETVVVFQDGTPAFEAGDVEKFVFSHPSAPQIATRSTDGVDLAISMFGMYSTAISIPVRVNVPINGNYVISATDLAGVDGLSCLVLEDLVTGALTPLTAGATYGFHMQANAGASTPRFMVHATAPVQHNLSHVLCNGMANGAAEVAVPSDMPFTVEWMDATGNVIAVDNNVMGAALIDGLAAGNYMVSVSGATSCGAMVSSFTIEEPHTMEATFQVTDANCPGTADGVIELEVLGGTAPHAFTWTNGASTAAVEVAAGEHAFTIVDANGCTLVSDVIVVGSGEEPVAAFAVEEPIVIMGQAVVFSNNSMLATEYLWDFGDGFSSTLMDPVHMYTLPGSYTVTLTAFNGDCSSSITMDVIVQVSTGAQTSGSQDGLHAWATNEAFVLVSTLDHGAVSIRVSDAAGRLHVADMMPLQGGQVMIPTARLSAGIWYLTVETGDMQRTFRLPLVR
jgi:hypothetical protein